MAVARVCTSEHFSERLKEKKGKMKVCYDIGLGVPAAGGTFELLLIKGRC